MKTSNYLKYAIPGVIAGLSAAVLYQVFKSTIPKNAKAVKKFNLKKYLGKWYEIARFDYRFEKGLDHVTANYSINDDGTLRVDNKGYDTQAKVWKESIGKAKPVGDPHEAKLKVSFFGPLYSGYNVIAIDKKYEYALVAGESTDYLWFLSRHKTMPHEIKKEYLRIAESIGYKVEDLVWTKQTNH